MGDTPVTPDPLSVLDSIKVAPKLKSLRGNVASDRRPPTIRVKKLQEVKNSLELAVAQETQSTSPTIIVSASQMHFTMNSMTCDTYGSLNIKPAPGGLFQSTASGPWIEIQPPGVEIIASATVRTVAPELSSVADEAASVWELGLIQALIANDQQIEYEKSTIEIRVDPLPCLDTSNELSKPWYNRAGVGSVTKSGNTIGHIPLIDRPDIKVPIDYAPRQAIAQVAPAPASRIQGLKNALVPPIPAQPAEKNLLRAYRCKETFCVWLAARNKVSPHEIVYFGNLSWGTEYAVHFDNKGKFLMYTGGVTPKTPASAGKGSNDPPLLAAGTALDNGQAWLLGSTPKQISKF